MHPATNYMRYGASSSDAASSLELFIHSPKSIFHVIEYSLRALPLVYVEALHQATTTSALGAERDRFI